MNYTRDPYIRAVIAVTAFAVLAMGAIRLFRPPAPAERPSSAVNLERTGARRIERVVDGDTLVLAGGETVRLIGVDAPELHHPDVPVQRFGEESAEFVRRLASGAECELEFEPGDRRDKYGRLLAYVYIGDTLLNAEIVRRGYGYALTRFPFSRMREFTDAERLARESQYGLWSGTLRDGRLANLAMRYEALNSEGRRRFDALLDDLVKRYPAEPRAP